MSSLLILYTLPALMLAAAFSDVAHYTIPNGISLALVACFAIAAPLVGLSWAATGIHVAVGLGALLLGFGLFHARMMGGGDAKLFAAGALWFGLDGLATYILGIALAGGLLCLVILAYRAIPRPVASVAWLRALHDRANGIPYGVAIAAGAIVALPVTDWMGLAFAA